MKHPTHPGMWTGHPGGGPHQVSKSGASTPPQRHSRAFWWQQQGGIITPAQHPVVIIITGEEGLEHGLVQCHWTICSLARHALTDC